MQTEFGGQLLMKLLQQQLLLTMFPRSGMKLIHDTEIHCEKAKSEGSDAQEGHVGSKRRWRLYSTINNISNMFFLLLTD